MVQHNPLLRPTNAIVFHAFSNLDVNECQQRHSCSKEAWCFNKIGSYQCVCKKGYTGDGKNCEGILMVLP